MARPVDPQSAYRVKTHTTNGYTYASTQPALTDPDTGKKVRRHVHWGRVDDGLRFVPGIEYLTAPPEERSRLVFPEGWDLSEAERLVGASGPGRPAYTGEDRSRFYGDIWLLEQVAEATGIRKDLEKVFPGNKKKVDDILTLAVFPYVTGFSYNRVARWQRIAKAPSERELDPAYITRLTQSVTESERMALLALRAKRLGPGAVLAVDSTTRSAYGKSLADVRWGKSKDRLPLAQTLEVVAYTLDGHMPVYYRTFPGNMPDSRSLETILLDLRHAGFSDVVLVTDRGYETMRTLEGHIAHGQAMVACTKVAQGHVLKAIDALGAFAGRPEGMDVDPATRLYYSQSDIPYEVRGKGGRPKAADRLRLNLYFDAVRRGDELVSLDIDIDAQRALLAELCEAGGPVDDAGSLKRACRYFKVAYRQGTATVESYELDEGKVARAKKTSGFFAITTHKLDYTAMEALRVYRLRDEQEKYFSQMKSQMAADRQRNWSEEGKTGRLFILFVSMVIGSYMRHVWESTALCKHFSSTLEVLDEMRSIRCVEHTNRARHITPFVGDQVRICDAFGFSIPEGCSPEYVSKQAFTHKRGRPRKKKATERDY
jgi:hypothetical protein